MAVFENHKLPLAELLKVIPEEKFASLAAETNVDYYVKVLKGKLMFYLLMYALLIEDKPSQRGLADIFSSPQFRILFNCDPDHETIVHSSISDRLAKIEVDFFRQFYDCMYKRFSTLYPSRTVCGLNLQRVDSSLVAETSNKLREGLTCGNEYKKRKMLKFTVNYDGQYGSCVQVHKEEKYANESIALPENVMEHFKKSTDHANVYIFDRGLSSATAFASMKSHKGLLFVGRLVENRKLNIIKEMDCTFKRFEYGVLKQDALVQLYRTETVEGKNGRPVKRQILVTETYRVIRFRPKGKAEDILLITNLLHLRAETVAFMYRRRWDIEVFFRFLKQEVNFSHFISLSENGIQVILYMTLIVAMMIMVYKKENELGFKTAKRRIKIELQELIIAIVAAHAHIGGDLINLNLPAP